MLHAEKAALRKLVAKRLAELPDAGAQSASLTQRLLRATVTRTACHVGAYVSCARLREVDTLALLPALLAPGRAVYAPRTGPAPTMRLLRVWALGELAPSAYGVLEPPGESGALDALDAPLDLVLVPGVAFDRAGNRRACKRRVTINERASSSRLTARPPCRLGRGGGYYDSWLRSQAMRARAAGRPPALRVALAFDVQLVDAVPATEQDERVDVVLTASETVLCRPGVAFE